MYDATGQIESMYARIKQWDFTHMDKVHFLQDWMYAPVMGFDSNNSFFVQNNVNLDESGLHLCMMNLWDNMATTGHISTGCDGKMLLPPPGAITPTDFSQALVVVTAKFTNGDAISGKAIGNSYPEVIPKMPTPIQPGYFNNGWATGDNNACNNPYAINGLSCGSSNGWFADSRVENIAISGTAQYQATYIIQTATHNVSGTPYTNFVLAQANHFGLNGHDCQVSYTPSALTLQPQATYNVTANVNCGNTFNVKTAKQSKIKHIRQ